MIFGLIAPPKGISDIVGTVPSLEPIFGHALFNLGNIFTIEMLVVILTFMFVDFFDTAGTLVAVATQAGIMKDGKLPRAGRALASDSSGTVFGAILGTSSTTSYVESTTGVAVGAKSGFAALVTAICFLLPLFFLAVITYCYSSRNSTCTNYCRSIDGLTIKILIGMILKLQSRHF